MQTRFCPRLTLAVCLVIAAIAQAEQKDPAQPPKQSTPRPAPPIVPEKGKAPAAPVAPEKEKGPASANVAEKDKFSGAPMKAEPSTLPADTIFVLIDKMEDALRQVLPRYVLLKPESYKEITDEIKKLRQQVRPNRPVPPSSCSLKGKAEGSVAQLQAQFDFATDQPNVLVLAACGQASILAANLDGHTVVFRNEFENFTIQAEKPGNHKLVLDLAVPLTTRAGGLSLELDLPRTAITNLELDLPAGARDVRLGSKALEPPATLNNNRLVAPLGLVSRLEVSWKDGKTAGGTTPLLSAESRVLVRIDERLVATTAELTLGTQGGAVKEYRLQVPAGAKAAVRAEEGRVLPVESSDGPQGSIRIVRLKEPSLEPVRVTVTAQSALPRPGSPLGLGPFNLLGAARQAGTILVSNTATDLRSQLHPRGELERREITDDEQRADPNLIAAYAYRTVATGEKAGAGSGPAQPWIDLDIENVRGLIETRVSHTLTLHRVAADRLTWRVATTLHASPIRTGVDHLEVLLPPDCVYDKQRGPRPPELIRHVEFDDMTRLLHFKLMVDPRSFLLTLEGLYQQPAADSGRLTLALPVARDTRDRGGLVTVQVPDDIELVLPEAGNFGMELDSQAPQKVQWHSDRIPESVEIGWQRYRPEVRVANVIDLTLTPREGQVHQQIRLQFARSSAAQVALRLPAALADRVVNLEGGRFKDSRGQSAGLRQVELLGTGGNEQTLTLDYSFRAEARTAGQPLPVPLATVDGVAAGETKVRVWCEPGSLPLPPAGSWEELNVEEVKGRDRLPVLVLRNQRLDAPLALPLGEPAGSSPLVLVERALIRATFLDSGGQAFHASFLLRQMAGAQLDLELPASIPGLNLVVALGGKQLAWEILEDGTSRVARLRIGPELVRQPTLLDVWFQLPVDRAEAGIVRSYLDPPRLRGAAEQTPVRWEIELPGSWIPLAPEGGPGAERTWGRRGRLLGPRLTSTRADLERWLAGRDLPSPVVSEDALAAPSQILWRSGLEPVVLTHVPEKVWFMVCSLGVLVVGLGLAQISRPSSQDLLGQSRLFLPALALITVAGAALWLLYPTLLNAVLYGGQIGAVVLLLFLLFQWILRERYRRQVVFLSSFSRSRKGSSVVRPAGSSVARKRREPSTVDAPPPGSSLAAERELP